MQLITIRPTSIPFSTQDVRSTLTLDLAKTNFRSLRKNAGILCSRINIGQVLKGLNPKTISESLNLLNGKVRVLKDLRNIFSSLPEDDPLKSPLDQFCVTLEQYNAKAFLYYYVNKAAKKNASLRLKTDFVLWCLAEISPNEQDPEKLMKERNADTIWFFCHPFLPRKISEINLPAQGQEREKFTTLIQSHLNKRLAVSNSLEDFQRTQNHDIAHWIKEIHENRDFFSEPSSVQEMRRFFNDPSRRSLRQVQTILSTIDELTLDYAEIIVRYSLDTPSRIEMILFEMPHYLRKGSRAEVEGLLNMLLTLIDSNQTRSKILASMALDVWMLLQANEATFRTNHGESKLSDLIQMRSILEEASKIDRPVPKLVVYDPDFSRKLTAKFDELIDSLKRKSIDEAAGKAPEIVKMMRCFTALDEAQADEIKGLCREFRQNYTHIVTEHRKGKDRKWNSICSLFQNLEDKELDKRIRVASKPDADPNWQKFSDKMQELTQLLENLKFGPAIATCQALVNLARKLPHEASAQIANLLGQIASDSERLLNNSKEAYRDHLQTSKTRLWNFALQLLDHPGPNAPISTVTAEELGDAFESIYTRTRDDDFDKAKSAVQYAVDWYGTAKSNDKQFTWIHIKLSNLHQDLENNAKFKHLLKESWAQGRLCNYLGLIQNSGADELKTNPQKYLRIDPAKYPYMGKTTADLIQLKARLGYINQLVEDEKYAEAYPYLIELIALNKAKPTSVEVFFSRHYLGEVLVQLLLVDEKTQCLSNDELKRIISQTDDISIQAACMRRLYPKLESHESDLAAEYKYKILAEAIATSARHKKTIKADWYSDHEEFERYQIGFIGHFSANIQSYFQLYQYYCKQGMHAKAQALYQKMLNLPLTTAGAAFTLSDSLETLLAHVNQQEIDPDVYYNMARWFIQRNHVEMAERLFDKALQIDPMHLPSVYEQGCLYRAANRKEEAIDYFKRVTTTFENFPKEMTQWSLDYVVNIYFQNSSEQRREFVKNRFSDVRAFVSRKYLDRCRLAVSEAHRELASLDPANAYTHLTQAVAFDPSNYRAYYERALCGGEDPVNDLCSTIFNFPHWHQGAWENLEKHLSKEVFPGTYYSFIGKELFDDGRVEEAVFVLERAVEVSCNDGSVYERLGDCYTKQQRIGAALRCFNAARLCDNPRTGRKERATEAQWKSYCSFSRFGGYFKNSLERLKQLLHELKLAQSQDVGNGSAMPSAKAINRRQEVLIKAHNLLNQVMQLYATCLKSKTGEEVRPEFPFRKMAERQTAFTPETLNELLDKFKLPAHSIHKYLKQLYRDSQTKIEAFIEQANQEKHVGFGEQVLSTETFLEIDGKKGTHTVIEQPVFLDSKTQENPVKQCQRVIVLVENCVETVLSFLDGRISLELLKIHADASRKQDPMAIWNDLLSSGSIDRSGKVLGPISMGGEELANVYFEYLYEAAYANPMQIAFKTHFDLQQECFIPKAPQLEPSVLDPETSLPLPRDIAVQMQEARQLAMSLSKALASDQEEQVSNILFLHAELVSKLMNSLDHAMYNYCRERFGLSEESRIQMKGLFFPVAGSKDGVETQINEVFNFLLPLRGTEIAKADPAFYTFLSSIQPCTNPDYAWLQLLHDAWNIEKHDLFFRVLDEKIATTIEQLEKRTKASFYFEVIGKIELLHKQLEAFSQSQIYTV